MNIKKYFLNFLSKDANKGAPISPKEAYAVIQKNKAVLVDVRELDEIQKGMATPAQWLAMSEIESRSQLWENFMSQLPKDKQIIIYCAAGGRAGRWATELSENGFQTSNMGGFEGWVKAGLPIKTPNF